MSELLSQKYPVVVRGEGDQFVEQIYTDKLSEDGKTIHTYRPDGTLCLKKEFNSRGQYVFTRYDSSGQKEEYRVIGGSPDQRTSYLFQKGKKAKKQLISIPFKRRSKIKNQKTRGE